MSHGIRLGVDRLAGGRGGGDITQTGQGITGGEPADHGGGQQDDGRGEDGRDDAGHVQLQGQDRGQAALDAVSYTHLTPPPNREVQI